MSGKSQDQVQALINDLTRFLNEHFGNEATDPPLSEKARTLYEQIKTAGGLILELIQKENIISRGWFAKSKVNPALLAIGPDVGVGEERTYYAPLGLETQDTSLLMVALNYAKFLYICLTQHRSIVLRELKTSCFDWLQKAYGFTVGELLKHHNPEFIPELNRHIDDFNAWAATHTQASTADVHAFITKVNTLIAARPAHPEMLAQPLNDNGAGPAGDADPEPIPHAEVQATETRQESCSVYETLYATARAQLPEESDIEDERAIQAVEPRPQPAQLPEERDIENEPAAQPVEPRPQPVSLLQKLFNIIASIASPFIWLWEHTFGSKQSPETVVAPANTPVTNDAESLFSTSSSYSSIYDSLGNGHLVGPNKESLQQQEQNSSPARNVSDFWKQSLLTDNPALPAELVTDVTHAMRP